MANQVLSKFGTSTALTCTLASLSSSTTGVGRQTNMFVNDAPIVHFFLKIKTGASPTANKTIKIYLLKANKSSSPDITTDNAGTSDAAHTVVTADCVYSIVSSSSATTYYASFSVVRPGPLVGLSINHDTVAALDGTAGNHSAYYLQEYDEVQ